MKNFKCYEKAIPDGGCTKQCVDCKIEQALRGDLETSVKKAVEITGMNIYTEKEARELAASISAGIGFYVARCLQDRNENPDTEGEFIKLFNLYKKQ